jgi:hypothetical protein
MSRREEAIARLSEFLEQGVKLAYEFPDDGDLAELELLIKRCEVLGVLILKAKQTTDKEWEREHPAQGTWRRRWHDVRFQFQYALGLWHPRDPSSELEELVAKMRSSA